MTRPRIRVRRRFIVGRVARRRWSSAAAIRPSPPLAWRLLPGSAARREQRQSGPTVARQHHAARRRSVVCLASWERPACFINTRGATGKVTGGSGWQRSAGNLEIPAPNLTPSSRIMAKVSDAHGRNRERIRPPMSIELHWVRLANAVRRHPVRAPQSRIRSRTVLQFY